MSAFTGVLFTYITREWVQSANRSEAERDWSIVLMQVNRAMLSEAPLTAWAYSQLTPELQRLVAPWVSHAAPFTSNEDVEALFTAYKVAEALKK